MLEHFTGLVVNYDMRTQSYLILLSPIFDNIPVVIFTGLNTY